MSDTANNGKRLTSTEAEKVIGKGVKVTPSEVAEYMDLPSGSRPRVYAYLCQGDYAGQTVKITSQFRLDQYLPDAQFFWLSHTTFANLAKPA